MGHKHHILPRHAGGSDEPSNLVEVRVVQHAMWHFANWQLWGRKEDWLAWRGLAGYLGKEEIINEKIKLGGSRGNASLRENNPEVFAENGRKNLEKLREKDPDHDKKAAKKGGKAAHEVKNSEGKSVHAVKNGLKYGKAAAAVRKEQMRKPVVMTEVQSGETFAFPSVRDAARGLGVHYQNIAKCCNGKRKTTGGFTAEWG